MAFFVRTLINALVVFFLAHYIPGITVDRFLSALFFAVILGILNALLRPLFVILTLPLHLLTFGLFTLVTNAVIFWLASTISFGVEVQTVAAAFWSSFIVGAISILTSYIFASRRSYKN